MQVFVVGAPRSGTTRIKTAIADAMGLPRSGEGHFYPIARDLDAALDGYFDRWSGRAGERTMLRAVSRDELRREIHAVVRRAFDAVAGTAFVEKTPGAEAIQALPMVVEQWPESKIVFVKRRGIENVISALWKFPHWSFEGACRNWTDAMSAWATLDRTIRQASIEVDQAEMAKHPETTAARLGGYLRLSQAQTAILAEAFTRRAHARVNRRVGSMAELQRDPIPLSSTSWTEEQRATFVEICGGMMSAFGYRLE
ncbi:MAG TPA: sulfotransferase [Bauldia sp.]|nr:sulfotransferase [Bauldia sp.]